MRADLVLLTLAFSLMAGSLAVLVIQVKRIVCQAFAVALDGAASDMR